jgi:hypothetical protein
MKSRMVNELSLMCDVMVELERLKRSLEGLRDALVREPDAFYHVEIGEAKLRCRRIVEELKCISSLLWVNHEKFAARLSAVPSPEPPKPQPPQRPRLVTSDQAS